MSFQGGFDGSEPVRGEGVATGRHEHRRAARSSRLGTGTLACPVCDAPVFVAGPLAPAARLACPFCRHGAAARDFLSLAAPARPARVEVRVVARARPAA